MDLQDGDYPVNIRSNGQVAMLPMNLRSLKAQIEPILNAIQVASQG